MPLSLLVAIVGFAFACFIFERRVEGFALLGPYTDWMKQTNGYHQPGDIGGPMDINEGYRWNVPVVTYGFDHSFMEFFGTNGLAAIESAIQMLNDIPPSSSIVLTNYPNHSVRVRFTAQAQGMYDLKSAALSLLLQQMGLSQPVRYVFAMRNWSDSFLTNRYQWEWESWAIPDYIIQRNFDPQSLLPSTFVDDVRYTAEVYYVPGLSGVFTFQADATMDSSIAVAENNLGPGNFFIDLTRDDIGGLRYLLGTNNVCYEELLPDVHGSGTNLTNYVNGAWRPGIEKVTFMPQPVDPSTGQYLPMTNQFADAYIRNGTLLHQQLERVTSQADITFSAPTTWEGAFGPAFRHTGTSNWINNAALNGTSTNAGPGVIRPPIRIEFRAASPLVEADDYGLGRIERWASFDASTNAIIPYPAADSHTTNELSVSFELQTSSGTISFGNPWRLPLPVGASFSLQISPDLTNWFSAATLTNTGVRIDWICPVFPHPHQFFRVAPQ